MTTIELGAPILQGGNRHVHFFEGRLLSGRDLRDEQAANRVHHRQAGRAVGAGIVDGLFVTAEHDGADGNPPVVSVAAGLAVNPEGHFLELREAKSIALSRAVTPPVAEGELFSDCRPVTSHEVPFAAGLYVLVMSPVSAFRERAPKVGLQSDGKVNDCSHRYEVEGVVLRLEPLSTARFGTTAAEIIDLMNSDQPSDLSLLRNLLAHLCIGTVDLIALSTAPFQLVREKPAFAAYGVLDDLRRTRSLSPCDVPLALIYWTRIGLRFVDVWSVRRRPIRPEPTGAWPCLLGARREAEADAVANQFHDHLGWLIRSSTSTASITASTHFRYLPAAGLLPLRGSAFPGVDADNFFSGITHSPPRVIDRSLVQPILRTSADFEPFDVRSEQSLWLFRVRQNDQVVALGANVQPYMVFATPHLDFVGSARFDVSRWDYAHFV